MEIKLKFKRARDLGSLNNLIGQWMLNFDYGPCVVSDWSVGPYNYCNDVNFVFFLFTSHTH